MKIARSLVKLSGLLVVVGTLFGASYATNVAHQTTLCAQIYSDDSHSIKSLQIIPYYNDTAVSSNIRAPSLSGSCITFDTDRLLGAAQPGTSFSIQGLNSKGIKTVIENRDMAAFEDIKNDKKITLRYNIFTLKSIKGSPVIGSVVAEDHISDTGRKDSYQQFGDRRSNQTMNDAFDVIKQIGATKYTRLADFHGDDKINREQVAKFFLMTWMTTHSGAALPSPGKTCSFTDDHAADQSLVYSIHTICALGIMKGGAGKFNPKSNITLGEVTTILIRMQYGTLDENQLPWYKFYFEKAFDVNLFDSFAYNPDPISDGDILLSRGMIGLMIKRILQINNVPIKVYPTI